MAFYVSSCASKGREGGVFFCESFVLSQPWGVMHRIQWDPERYDYLSIHQFWLSTWSIWDHSSRVAYVEVRCFAFLDLGDLQLLCGTCYGIYMDSSDIRDRLDEYRQSVRDT